MRGQLVAESKSAQVGFGSQHSVEVQVVPVHTILRANFFNTSLLVVHSNAVQVGFTIQHSGEVHVLLAHGILVGESFKRKSVLQVNPSQVAFDIMLDGVGLLPVVPPP